MSKENITISISNYENGTLEIKTIEIEDNQDIEEALVKLGYNTTNCEWFHFNTLIMENLNGSL